MIPAPCHRADAFRVVASLVLLGMMHRGAFGRQSEPEDACRWFKGNTHAHTLWSDGDGAPELVADWYVSRGYDFLVLSDHNILSTGQKWFAILDLPGSRLTSDRVAALKTQFGEDAVETRAREDQPDALEMRLKTLDELRARFEVSGAFLFIQGEEITDSFARRPVHINAANIDALIQPQHGESVRETMQNNIDAVIAHGRAIGRPVLAHINHPNFGWGLTVDDVAAVEGERFFEVYNGHPSVRNEGDSEHPSMEQMWDLALTQRLRDTGLGVLYGIATDDGHHYHEMKVGQSNPGRGWVMVRSTELTPDAIVSALRTGDFYASSGVTLKSVSYEDDALGFVIAGEENVSYVTQFIGTRRGGEVGEVLHATSSLSPRYEMKGDEWYVRAVVTSSRLHPNPYANGDFEIAWLQPVVGGDGDK